MKLSPDQITLIRRAIDQSAIKNDLLKDDVLDHICCVTEHKISRGKKFEVAVEEAFRELAPGGLDEIQREAVFLLNSEKIIIMKKAMYSVGLISSMALSLGWLFRFLRWPGGDELATYGFFGFAFIFVPMLAINQFKVDVNKPFPQKMRIILGTLSGLVTGTAVFFKLMHYQGTDLLLLGGAGLFIFGFLPLLFFTMYQMSVS